MTGKTDRSADSDQRAKNSHKSGPNRGPAAHPSPDQANHHTPMETKMQAHQNKAPVGAGPDGASLPSRFRPESAKNPAHIGTGRFR